MTHIEGDQAIVRHTARLCTYPVKRRRGRTAVDVMRNVKHGFSDSMVNAYRGKEERISVSVLLQ